MKFLDKNSDSAILKELGSRIALHRLNRNLAQEELAKEAGISLRTLVRIEGGYPAQTPNIVRLLRVLHLLENLEALIPEPPISPVQQLKMQGKQRKRASSKSAASASKQPWSWGADDNSQAPKQDGDKDSAGPASKQSSKGKNRQ
tara:strand:+ start:1099 stop:1533 length:435 start_codon:yes stop_codon:yes gene_type:complete